MPTGESKILGDSDALSETIQQAERNDMLFPVSEAAFVKGPATALEEALASEPDKAMRQRAARSLNPDLMVASGDGAVFRPFRFPTKISEAFKLPWGDIGQVTQSQLDSFRRGTQMDVPIRIIGATVYLHYHYLTKCRQLITSKGRHLLFIKLSEGSGRQLARKCLAWWMPLAEVRERFADPRTADAYAKNSSVYRACHMVETYPMNTTVVIHFEAQERGERGSVKQVGGWPFNCFDVAPDFKAPYSVHSTPEELEEEKRIIAQCIEERRPLELTKEAKEAEKRRRKRQAKKVRDKEKAAAEAQVAKELREEKEREEEAQRKSSRPKANVQDWEGVLEQMRLTKATLAAERSPASGTLRQPLPKSFTQSDSSESSDSD